ncbi:hypothetical protein J3B02_003854 [Coemansia erecta]|nr:hypothetical protein J3B02_003854 [Coemansia erecta]KAJ2887462.1 hypothetical protein FB639_001295 [Coemansia asiatica]
MVNTSTVPLFQGLLAKAGISKARQISSPFNVQHDVHISVEDLDDLMQQVPDTWKPFISPAQSPRSATGPRDSQGSDSQHTMPTHGSMPAAARHSADNAEALSEQMSRSSMAEEGASRANKGPGSQNWLPHIVSVSSPQDGADTRAVPSAKQRSVSGQSENNGWSDGRTTTRTSCISVAAEQLEMTTVRVPTPVSAPTGASIPRLVHASMLRRSPASEKSTFGENAASAADQATSPQSNNGSAMIAADSPSSTGSSDRSSRWIKRKSRVISTHAMTMAHKRFSKAAVPISMSAFPEDDEPSVEPSAPIYPSNMTQPNAEALGAAAEAAANAAAVARATAATATTDSADQPGMLKSQDSVRSLEKSAGTVSGKSSKKRRENYGELEEYAEGDSGNVYITVRNTAVGRRPRGEYVAVKVVPKTAKARYRKLRTELKILRRIRSQHVVRFYEYFSIDDAVWIVYEFMSRGSVTDLLAGYPEIRMPNVIISYTMHEVLTALAYLHERHIIHCDVRSDNVLIDDRGQVKLADFSSAVYLDVDQQSAQKTSLGAIYWMAPELAKGAGYSPSTDVWAAGALIYEMLEGQPPYIEYPDIKVLELSNANGMPKLSDPDACDAGLVELMRLCTTINPAERQPASRLRKHESVLSPDTAQCAQLMVDFVLQVESLAGDDDEEEEGEVGE